MNLGRFVARSSSLLTQPGAANLPHPQRSETENQPKSVGDHPESNLSAIQACATQNNFAVHDKSKMIIKGRKSMQGLTVLLRWQLLYVKMVYAMRLQASDAFD